MNDRTITVEQACSEAGCGKSHMYALLNANEIQSWTTGRKRVVSEASVFAYIARKKAEEIAKQRAGKDPS